MNQERANLVAAYACIHCHGFPVCLAGGMFFGL